MPGSPNSSGERDVLEQPYKVGDYRAVMIEASREAIELIEIR